MARPLTRYDFGVIYLDNAASTRPDPEVVAAMSAAATDLFANPSSAHAAGAAAARALEQARAAVAAGLAAEPAELIFTSGGTEANALGVAGAARRARGRHLCVSSIEHPSVLEAARALAAGGGGFELTEIPVGPSGRVDPAAVAAVLRPDTAVVAVMLVNNELGTVQPVAEIARLLRERPRRPHFHVDAVQALGVLPVRPAALGTDSLAISAHKIHGPKGAGALWLRPGVRLAPLWEGGGQERGLRSGTENLPGIVGLGRAVALAEAARAGGAAAEMARLRDGFEARALEVVPQARPTVPAGEPGGRAPHISSLALPDLPAEPLLHALEARGFLAAAGSACASKTRGPSHVLTAIGVRDTTAVLRFSLSRHTTAAELDAAAAALATAVAEVRAVSRPARRGRR